MHACTYTPTHTHQSSPYKSMSQSNCAQKCGIKYSFVQSSLNIYAVSRLAFYAHTTLSWHTFSHACALTLCQGLSHNNDFSGSPMEGSCMTTGSEQCTPLWCSGASQAKCPRNFTSLLQKTTTAKRTLHAFPQVTEQHFKWQTLATHTKMLLTNADPYKNNYIYE